MPLIPVLNHLNLEGHRVTGLPVNQTNSTDAVSKAYLDKRIRTSLIVLAPVISRGLNTPPAEPVDGARYIIGTAPTGVWSGHANKIAEWRITEYEFTSLIVGQTVWVTAENTNLTWNGTAWVKNIGEVVKAGTGIIKVDDTISVQVDTDSIEVDTDGIKIKDGGIKSIKIAPEAVLGTHIKNVPKEKVVGLQAELDEKVSSDYAQDTFRRNDTPVDAEWVENLSPVAYTGAYSALTGKPTLGTASQKNVEELASAAQGLKADTALQVNSVAPVAITGKYQDLDSKPTTFPSTWSTITGKPTTFTPVEHVHQIEQIEQLEDVLDTKYVKPVDGIPNSDIKSVDAVKITTGVFSTDRIPNLGIGKITDLEPLLTDTAEKIGELDDDPDPNGSILARVGYLEIDLANVSYEANRRLRRVVEEQSVGASPVVITHALGTADVTVTFMSITAPIKPVLDIDWEVENVDSIKVSSGTYTGTVRVLIDG